MPTGTLLLIDDEAELRQALARLLELDGYTVRQARTAQQGLELLRQHADEVLVVLSDMKLPGSAASTCCRATGPWRRWPRWCCSRPTAPSPTACRPCARVHSTTW